MLKKYFSRKKQRIEEMTQPTLEHWSDLNADFRERRRNLLRNRTVNQDLLEGNFQLVLNAWGMRESDIPHVLQSLRLRLLVFLVPLVFAVFTLFQGLYLVSAILALVSLVGFLTTKWRISILESRRFRPFHRALVAFITQKLTKG